MRAKAALVVLAVLAVVLAGCAAQNVPGAVRTEDGLYLFSADGESAVAKEGDALSLAEAKLAAATIAKANLLEKINGAAVKGSAKVKDLMFASQEASTAVEGYLARATVTFEPQPRVPEPVLVKATASLALSEDDLENLKAYVE